MEPKKEMDENGDQQMDEVVISEAEPQAELSPESTSPPTPTAAVVKSGQLEGMDPETGNYIRPPAGSTPQKPLQIPKIVEPSSEENGEEGGRKARKKLGQHANNNNNVTAQPDPNQLTTTSGKSLKEGWWSRRMISTISNKSRTEEEEEEDGGDNCIFGNQIRFTIMIISTLCLSSILSNILTFNFTFICMAGDRPDNYTTLTEAELQASGYRPDLDYSSTQRSALFMAVAVGALLAVFPLTIALNKFGSRLVFGILGYISACSTYLIPISANIGFPCILLMRVIQGVGFSACLPVMGSITSHWSTLKQNGIFIAILSSFLQIAPIFTMPISGELCTSSLGWPAVYYLHGTVCVFLFTLFILYHRNTPNKHPLIQRTELTKMMFGKGSIYSGPGRQRKSKKVPYSAMYRDPAIWAILVAAFGNFMGTQLSLQFMPTYINKVLFLPIEQTVWPQLYLRSDRITFISDQVKLRIYNTLSMGLMGFFFIVLGMLDPVNQKSLCLVVLITSTCILGFNSGGFFKSSQMVSRQHSHFTLANISFVNCVCMLLVPLLNELIAPENTPETWK
uniref:Major facilitator superfamily (MFS) profile domain-containing protein n=1 Tax=Ditylenchus dipsaci TaxID=166011 RepID=A0A915CW51_9BILA